MTDNNENSGSPGFMTPSRGLSDFGDRWTGGYWSPYFHTFSGQLEYWILLLLAGAYNEANHRPPVHYYGAYNGLMNYLVHWAYGPFVDHAEYKEKYQPCWPPEPREDKEP